MGIEFDDGHRVLWEHKEAVIVAHRVNTEVGRLYLPRQGLWHITFTCQIQSAGCGPTWIELNQDTDGVLENSHRSTVRLQPKTLFAAQLAVVLQLGGSGRRSPLQEFVEEVFKEDMPFDHVQLAVHVMADTGCNTSVSQMKITAVRMEDV